MGSNLSKRRSQSSGNLLSGKPVEERYQLCASLPNHLDLPGDNNNGPIGKGGHNVTRQEQDQGYASERSPEEERSPPFPACPVHHASLIRKYPFINSDSTFSVVVTKGSGGLGLSVCGGEPWPGLVRIKRLFPHQPASHSGQLQPGDILLAASGIPLLGLTNYEALEVLRATPSEVKLTICRPPEQVLPPTDTVAPPPPPRDPQPLPSDSYGEFEIWMEKQNGSLGFTLRKEDQSALGHYVRALVREPALSDPRIKPGDKIIAVNDVEMSSMSHEEAVAFLRQCGTKVKLRLFRDPAQTPVPPHSPTHTHRTFKPILRKEAQDMLSELAVRKSQSPQDSSGSSCSQTRGSSPRKRRLTKTPPPTESVESLGSDESQPRRPEQLSFTLERKPSPYLASPNLAQQFIGEDVLVVSCGLGGGGSPPSEPVSMPPLTTTDSGFSYRNPAYRSANPAPSKPQEELAEGNCSEQDIPSVVESEGGTKGLLKWKNVLFSPEEEHPPIPDLPLPPPPTEVLDEQFQRVVVELNRGWNSRLGFSLQKQNGATVISAIYPDSVASRDGRLRVGDKLIIVNDESTETMETADVIDLLRKIRGSICLTLLRKKE